jgi:hypothetical protein
MKLGARVISALIVVAFVAAPALLSADQLAKPVDRSVFPGVTTIQYANQTLVFTTPVALRVKLSVLPNGSIQLRLKAQSTQSAGQRSSSLGQAVVFWQEGAQDIFNGAPPGDWVDVPFGEGGWTEK